MKISCCIDMMFSYCDFYERFSEVKNCGINTVEFWKWTNKNIDKIMEIKQKLNFGISVFNLDSTDPNLSYDLSRGILNDGRADDLILALDESIPVYKRLGASAMIVLVGEGKPLNRTNVINSLKCVAEIAEANDVLLIVEPLNNIDRVGYSLPYAKQMFEILKEVNSPNVKMLYDIYHQNMMGDFDINEVKANIDLIGHFHVADAPGRHEPYTGKVDYRSILSQIEATDYEGFVGLEYRATKPDKQTFGFLEGFEYV